VTVPPALEAIVLACLTKAPADRVGSVGELAAQLAPFATREGRAAVARLVREAPARPAPARGPRRWLVACAVALIAAPVGLLGIAALRQRMSPAPLATSPPPAPVAATAPAPSAPADVPPPSGPAPAAASPPPAMASTPAASTAPTPPAPRPPPPRPAVRPRPAAPSSVVRSAATDDRY